MSAGRALLWSLALLSLACLAAPLSAQRLDPDQHWDTDQWQHAAGSAAIDLALRGPWLAPSWQRWYTRVAITTAMGVGYELLQTVHDHDAGLEGTGYGFGLLDIVADAAGALAAEAATALLDRLIGGGDRAPSVPPPVVALERASQTRPPTATTFEWPSSRPGGAARGGSISAGFAIAY